ncbi:MAG TPA: zinc ribbon domain-containing protein [Pyrinomonadaceae bacterium]|nr:zinc ribbon domain-containing protein [Pyrinomonadaceae bacterium]
MYCPKCATPNADDARFCRSCGTDISLVPQAVSGSLAERLAADEETREGRRQRRRHKGDLPSIERAIRGVFLGLAFIFIAFAVRTWAPAGHIWWFWMFIPAAINLADGIASAARLASAGKRREQQPYTPQQTAVPPPRRVSALPQHDTGEMIPPPSVTEGTTRHLGVPVKRKRGEG